MPPRRRGAEKSGFVGGGASPSACGATEMTDAPAPPRTEVEGAEDSPQTPGVTAGWATASRATSGPHLRPRMAPAQKGTA